MGRSLRALTVAALASWSVYLLYVSVVLLRLAEWFSPSEVVPTLLVPIAMLAAWLLVSVETSRTDGADV
jgi:hypothetical protein